MTIDPRSCALVLIDLQSGIVSRPLDPHDAKTVVANSVQLANAVSKAGGLIVPVHVGFSVDDGDRLKGPVDQPTPLPPGGMPEGWSDLVPEVSALGATVIIKKRNWSAFHGTELDLQLRRRGISTIILCGIATNFGVEQTAREAWQHGYTVVIPEDACTSLDAAMHRFSVESLLPRLARVRSTAEVLSSL